MRIVVAVLVHIEREEDHVDSVHILEDDDALASKGELLGILLVLVTFQHALPHVELAIG